MLRAAVLRELQLAKIEEKGNALHALVIPFIYDASRCFLDFLINQNVKRKMRLHKNYFLIYNLEIFKSETYFKVLMNYLFISNLKL